jgi:Tol biopolymer transport system component
MITWKRWLAAVSLTLVVASVSWMLIRGRRNEFGAAPNVARLTAATGFEESPSFSPDGTQMVYEWEREGYHHLYMKVVGPGDPVPLTSGSGAEYGPAWSPDGKWIAFAGSNKIHAACMWLHP